MQRRHDPGLTRNIGRAGDARPWRRKAQDAAAPVERDPVGEAGVTLGDRADLAHLLFDLGPEILPNPLLGFGHGIGSRWAMSHREPAMRRSPLTRTTLMLVKSGKRRSVPGASWRTSQR